MSGLPILEELRRRAFAVAYRMLGSVSEAEDIVQEALLPSRWLRRRCPALSQVAPLDRPAESLGGKRQLGPEGTPGTLVVGQFTDPEGNLIGVAGTE